MVDEAHLGAGALLLQQPRRAELRGRGDGGGRHGRAQPGLPGQPGQPGAVEVEHLGGVGAHRAGPAVAGHAVHAGDALVGQPGELALQHDAVAVAARQRDPRAGARRPHQLGHHRRREVRSHVVLADQQGVGRGGEPGGDGRDRGPVERSDAQVGDDDRPGVCIVVGAAPDGGGEGRRRRCRRRTRPGDDGSTDERAVPVVDLALPVDAHPAARSVDHVLRARRGDVARLFDRALGVGHRRRRHGGPFSGRRRRAAGRSAVPVVPGRPASSR